MQQDHVGNVGIGGWDAAHGWALTVVPSEQRNTFLPCAVNEEQENVPVKEGGKGGGGYNGVLCIDKMPMTLSRRNVLYIEIGIKSKHTHTHTHRTPSAKQSKQACKQSSKQASDLGLDSTRRWEAFGARECYFHLACA